MGTRKFVQNLVHYGRVTGREVVQFGAGVRVFQLKLLSHL